MANERNAAVSARMKEIMLALRARYLEDQRAGRNPDMGIPADQIGKDSITQAALRSWQQGKYIKVEHGMVRFDGMGFHEAFRIENKEHKTADTPEDAPSMFGER
jgi:hypothetical protein